MKEHHSKKKNQTFSLPHELAQDLHTYVKRREMSVFVAEAIRKELEIKKEELRKAYRSSVKDQGQLEAKEWDVAVNDGLEEW
jgi:hypothetical protein